MSRENSSSTSTAITIDWKGKCEQLEFEHQLEIERIRTHYEHELKDKITDISSQLKHEYDYRLNELSRHYEQQQQQQQQQQNLILNSTLPYDNTIDEQISEQLRIAQQYENDEQKIINNFYLLQQQQLTDENDNIDIENLKHLVSKLHTEGVQVLTLSELLLLQLNGVHFPESIKQLYDENNSLRELISNFNINNISAVENDNWRSTLIRCLVDIFSNEQQYRLNNLSMNNSDNEKSKQLEQEIHHMCNYQKDALDKLFSQERLSLIKELNDTKQQLFYIREQFKLIQQNLRHDLRFNDQNKRLILSTSYDDDINSFIYDKKIPYEYQKRILKLYFKYLKAESYRKALIYQKRYLIILLSGYEDTEKYALNEILRLKQNLTIPTSSALRYGKYQQQTKSYSRKTNNLLFLFRSRVRAVIAIIRMKYLLNKWRQRLALC